MMLLRSKTVNITPFLRIAAIPRESMWLTYSCASWDTENGGGSRNSGTLAGHALEEDIGRKQNVQGNAKEKETDNGRCG